jgi:hypothetical protein
VHVPKAVLSRGTRLAAMLRVSCLGMFRQMICSRIQQAYVIQTELPFSKVPAGTKVNVINQHREWEEGDNNRRRRHRQPTDACNLV